MAFLDASDGPAFEVVNPNGASSALLVCDHASFAIPKALGDLGLPETDRLAHIGWDIGAADVARRMSEMLDAPLVLAGYSRLVIDCNRPIGVASSIPRETGGIVVPGNRTVSDNEARARADACFWPYHGAIVRLLDERLARKVPTTLLGIHSFTPELLGQRRPWHISVLYGRQSELAERWLHELRKEEGLVVGANEPYRPSDGGDYTLPVHSEQRRIPGFLIEIRQDLIGHRQGVSEWAERLSKAHRNLDSSLR